MPEKEKEEDPEVTSVRVYEDTKEQLGQIKEEGGYESYNETIKALIDTSSPEGNVIKVKEGTEDRLDEIKDARDHESLDETINTLVDVYSPFLSDKVNKYLRQIARTLVSEGTIEKATEAEVVDYAIRFLIYSFLPEEKKKKLRRRFKKVKGGEM